MRILYVEDNPANIHLIRRVAKMGDHEVVNLIDGAEVLEAYAHLSPDLVLMDVQLSGELSGLDVVRELRQQGYQTHIVAVTAYAMLGDRERCLEAGCNDYLSKPLSVPRLVEIFQTVKQQKDAALRTDNTDRRTSDTSSAADPANIRIDTATSGE